MITDGQFSVVTATRVEFFAEGRVHVAHFLGQVTQRAALDESFAFKIDPKPEEKSGQPLQRRLTLVPQNGTGLIREHGAVMVYESKPEFFLALEIEVKRALGHSRLGKDLLQTSSSVPLVVNEAASDVEDVVAGGV